MNCGHSGTTGRGSEIGMMPAQVVPGAIAVLADPGPKLPYLGDQLLSGHVIEIRQVFEAEDFGAEFTPELRAQEERVRAKAEQLAKSPKR